MEHLDAKSDDFLILNPLNPPYQGDFKKECVSPMVYRKSEFSVELAAASFTALPGGNTQAKTPPITSILLSNACYCRY